jgi:hypothetical protein
MLELTETEKVLKKFVDYVVSESKKNAPKASGDLAKSIKAGTVKESANSIQVSIVADDYLPYIDQGVSGTERKFNTPFSYKSKGGKSGLKGMPPPKAFDRWNIIRGRAARDDKGRFLTRKQLNFATAVGVFKKGIRPTKFFTTPLEVAFSQLPEEIIEAYGLDVENLLETTLKDNRNGSI